MGKFKKKSMLASFAVTVINIAILFLYDQILEKIIRIFDTISPILIYFSTTALFVILIELILFIIRIKNNTSIRGKLLQEVNQIRDHSNLNFMGMWWAFSTWIFPVLLYKLIVLKYYFDEILQLSNGGASIQLGDLIAPYLAFRTFIEWKVYRESLVQNSQ